MKETAMTYPSSQQLIKKGKQIKINTHTPIMKQKYEKNQNEPYYPPPSPEKKNIY